MASTIAFVQTTKDDQMLILYSCVPSSVIRMSASLSYLDCRLVIPSNVVCCVASCLRYSFAEGSSDILVPLVGLDTIVGLEVAALIVVILLCGGLQRATHVEILNEVTGRANAIETSALSLLLENVCDVVLSMDSTFTILDEAKRFASMLMLDTTRSLKGTCIEHFMPLEEDKVRLRNLLTNGATAAVRCMNLNFRGGYGRHIGVEIFGVAFVDLDDATNYMLGIREENVHEYFDSEAGGTPRRQATSAGGSARAPLHPCHGTPPTLIGNALSDQSGSGGGENDETVSGKCGRSMSSGGTLLALPNLRETRLDVKKKTMRALLSSWNTKVSMRQCCNFHSSLPDVRMVLDLMSKGPCVNDLHAEVNSQCTSCGLLDCVLNHVCFACGQRQSTSL
eukprot:TRINITY_DN13580_c0_g1_i1.p1 TRINITY_DN13580_c0_g1~~TRINITY_DN13580_c0_g1_i1.p1  ORF type:complete len:420 (-),score=60.26 TRINITY_DN13580_c0_g1_i1:439-1620(-)